MKKKIIYFGLIILIGALLVPCMLSLPRLWNYEGSPDSWVGFWGSLLGSLLGVIGAYLVMSVQLQSDKETARLKEKKSERPYFFINSLNKKSISFEFYNYNHSLLNYTDIYFYFNDIKINTERYSLGHIKSDKIQLVEIKKNSKPDLIAIKSQTLSGENILFIYGNYNGNGITNTFTFSPKGIINVYTGPDDYHQFNDIIAKITGINLEKKKH